MRWGISSYKDLFELFSYSAIIIGFLTYFHGRNQFRYSIMFKCMERFQKLLPELDQIEHNACEHQRLRVTRLYIDLCEEELFFFARGYLPRAVADEWLEGMLGYLPFFDARGQLCNEKHKLKIAQNDPLLNGYPLIRRCFGHSESRLDPYEQRIIELIPKIKSQVDYF